MRSLHDGGDEDGRACNGIREKVKRGPPRSGQVAAAERYIIRGEGFLALAFRGPLII